MKKGSKTTKKVVKAPKKKTHGVKETISDDSQTIDNQDDGSNSEGIEEAISEMVAGEQEEEQEEEQAQADQDI